MKLPPFTSSRPLTLGVELELQLVNTYDYDLVDSTTDLLRLLKKKGNDWDVKPEITQGMVEMATGICVSHADVFEQLDEIRQGIVECADRLDIGVCGGGTHAFQHWSERRIYDTPRFDQLSSLYGYLAKQFTIFGQHVHVGCDNADEALTLLHLLSGFIPHFIALSASSPFVQGNDTGFHSARLNSVFSFPLSGRAPLIETWDSFGEYFDSMMATGIVKSMKDFYWDIRPKPEYGTIEVRVMDTPLTIEKAAQIAAFIQSLTRYLSLERPYAPRETDYLVYTFNRFQACRFGYGGVYVNPRNHEHRSLSEEILDTLNKIEPHAIALKADEACAALRREVSNASSDVGWLRQQHAQTKSLAEVVQRQCARWRV
ncbi:YbdK family carboxylate-amine ligase [Ferrovum sp.]|uniref:YbdK family carboxylate-amine ligase n=1 Tax=Ferrovum sp. TaxID=2609467 RepID=UPI002617DBB6|nr:YbdK family carboxylate-amine ligase [Ferrovum sp.]